MISFENDILTDKSLQNTDSYEQNGDIPSLSPTNSNDIFGTRNTTFLAVINTFSLDKISDRFPNEWNGRVPISHDFINKDTTVFPFAALRLRSPPSDTDSLIADDAPT